MAESKYVDWFKENYKNLFKYIIIRNLPILKLIGSVRFEGAIKNKQVIIYVGRLTRVRGIKEIVQAMEYVNDKAELWLLGKWESEKFKKECENLKGWKYTKYLGFKTLEEVYGYMKILFLLNNSNQAKKLGEKGMQLVEEEYHWEEENKKLLKVYKDL